MKASAPEFVAALDQTSLSVKVSSYGGTPSDSVSVNCAGGIDSDCMDHAARVN